jgi:hypothetical protein
MTDPEFLSNPPINAPQLALDSSPPEERRRELLARKDEFELAQYDQEKNGPANEETESLDEDLQKHLQINVAFKTIQILGQILRNYYGSMKGDKKLELVKECYSLGLRVASFGMV